ncbi:hypothetical protein FRB94_001367 [Tulasnella sp. JGI-2019a]|nr:hypothetical protein FRB93_008687 [Tulasnella sp. JGI-2019a]KAG8987894.1 hypothetical protein FRB94_001367 [Tulasnella sp. JGI-2019a]
MSQSSSASTGVFYAYAKTIRDNWDASYLITFATRDVADTWFRAVTDSVAKGYNKFDGVKRISMQFYSFNHHILDTVTDPKVAAALHDQVFFTFLNAQDRRVTSTAPVLNHTDHTNGTSFYIRSVAQPDTYWFYDATSDTVVAHRSRRSQFTIKIVDGARSPGTIIIGSDEIYITTTSGVNVGVANRENHLSYSANPSPLKFSSFANRDFQIAYCEEDRHPYLGPVARNPGKGERWELL